MRWPMRSRGFSLANRLPIRPDQAQNRGDGDSNLHRREHGLSDSRPVDRILQHIDHHAEDVGIQMAKGIEEYASRIQSIRFMLQRCWIILWMKPPDPWRYGYIHDYAVRGLSRFPDYRIWEGTNEINRLLIMRMLTQRAMKNRLPVLAAAQKVATISSLSGRKWRWMMGN